MKFVQDLAYFEPGVFSEEIYSGFGTRSSPLFQETLDADYFYFSRQIHGTEIFDINDIPQERITSLEGYDGFITKLPRIALLIKAADCTPVLYADPVTGYIGASHQGWKGTYDNMAQTMISRLKDKGADPKDICIAIGPCIHDCHYNIFDERAELIRKKYPQWEDRILRKGEKWYYLNVQELNHLQLREVGIQESHIEINDKCTEHDMKTFYSYHGGDDIGSDPMARNWNFIMKKS